MSRLRGLYAITSAELCADRAILRAAVAAALRGGALLIQYRDKHSDAAVRRANARELAALCNEHGAKLIINDDAELAHAVGAHGAHLGHADASLAQARTALGAAAILGASCGPSLERGQAAAAAGASYLAFGRFFVSQTKPDAPQADPEVLRQARRQFRLPLCAIGGVTPHNAGALIEAGADLIAAVDGVFSDPRPEAVEEAARAYSRLFDS
jgi:thiamine-phosphate pyrophosphorylase